MKLRSFFPGLLVIICSSLVFLGCKKKEGVEQLVISVRGSDTMVNLSQKWAEVYMSKNKEISIQVTGGGSGTGVAALLNGTTNIANSSRDLKENELKKAESLGKKINIYEVALDGIAVIVHPSNEVKNLTMEQIKNIFIREIKNWKEVGGKNLPIVLYGRENSSGTYEFFKENVLGKDQLGRENDFAPSTQVLQGTAALGEAVARDEKGIGYGGVGYFALRKDVEIIGVKSSEKDEPVEPATDGKVNYEAIWNNDYPISRYLYCITAGEEPQKVKDFISFIVSDEGQELVKTMEYIPLPQTN